ncbi:type II secretion system protein GspL [Aliamphritea ceti]|uniref:type II secretion system protein GspL n=1 Tax=Aliamphritea ceti TaxID=1524258 RepID=UPI0021C2EA23|nr:type II secretion system protein GspL [Aliamphritea ceti]
MKKHTVIHLLADVQQQQCSWIALQAKHTPSSGTVDLTNLESLANQFPDAACHVYLPSELISFIRLELPNVSGAALQTIPFQIEEFLAEPLEHCHIAYRHNGTDSAETLTCKRDIITRWQASFEDSGLDLQCLTADIFLLDSEHPTLWIDTNRILVHSCLYKGALPAEILPHILERHDTTELQILSCSGISTESSETLRQSKITPLVRQSIFTQEAVLKAQKSSVNLLSGEFAKYTVFDKFRSLVTAPAITAVFCLLLWLTSNLLGNYQLEKSIQHADQEMTALYKTLYPQAKKIINPASQMRANIKRQQDRPSHLSFISQLHQIAQLLSPGELHIKSIRYNQNNQSLQILLNANGFAPLEQIQAQLKHQNLNYKFGDLIQTPEGVSGLINLLPNTQGS